MPYLAGNASDAPQRFYRARWQQFPTASRFEAGLDDGTTVTVDNAASRSNSRIASLVLAAEFIALRFFGGGDPAPRPTTGELLRAWVSETLAGSL